MTLRPRFFDRLYVGLLVIMGVGAVIFGVMASLPEGPAHLHCERAASRCTMFWPNPVSTGDTYSYDLSTLKNSRTYTDKGGLGWKVDWGTRPLWLATSTHDKTAAARYTQLAGDFQAFLADPSRSSFDGTYTVATIPTGVFVFVIVLGLLCGYVGFRWWRGWKAELDIDPETREITIHRRPMFFTGPRTRKLPVGDLRLSEHIDKRYLGRGQSAKFATFELRDAHGKRVFKYTTLYDPKVRAVLDGYMQLLRSYISP